MEDSILRISGFLEESVVDGVGLRAVVFTQGCPHRCVGCHNPQTHPFSGGQLKSVYELADTILLNPLLSGATFSGGEPLCQPKPLAILAKILTSRGLNITIFTGYTFEEILKLDDPDINELLSYCSVLIDGRFEIKLRDLQLKFRGSKNQRILDCPASLLAGRAVLLDI